MTEIHPNLIKLLPFLRGGKTAPPSLRVGEEILAQVVEKLKGDRYLIRIKDVEVTAESRVPLSKGDQIPLKIAKVSPEIILTPMQQSGKSSAGAMQLLQGALRLDKPMVDLFSSLRETLLNLPQTVRQVLGQEGIQKLMEMIPSLILQEGTTSEQIRRMITRNGLFFETDLKKALLSPDKELKPELEKLIQQDLKGNLQELSRKLLELMREAMEPGKGEELNRLLESIQRFTKALETRQMINHLLIQNDKPLHFELPLSMGGEIQTLDLYYQESTGRDPEKKESDGKHFKMVFLMDLKTLGKIRIDLLVIEKKIDCFFTVEKQDLSHLIESSLGFLSEGLQKQGFSIGSLRASQGSVDEIMKIETEEKTFLKEMQIVDLKI